MNSLQHRRTSAFVFSWLLAVLAPSAVSVATAQEPAVPAISGAAPVSQAQSTDPESGDEPQSPPVSPFSITDGNAGDIFLTGEVSPYTASGVLLQSRSSWPDVVAKTGTSDAGSAFAVYNSSDLPLFRVRSDGYVGIGTTTPSALIHFATDNNAAAGFRGEYYGDLGNPRLQLGAAAGTPAAPSPITAGRQLGSINYLGFNNGQFIQGARVAATAETIGTADMPTYLAFYTTAPGQSAASERLRITSTGRVGIGTSTPTATLEVAGDASFTGTVSGGNIQAKYQDVAEWVPSVDQLPAGTVVVLDPARDNHVIASSHSYDSAAAGVVSDQPGVLLGERGDGKLSVATVGRVRVRVDATKNPIRRGDLLVTSDLPGRAMRSEPIEIAATKVHRPGTVIGKALEPLQSGVGEILVLLSLQ